ncbi:MAG: hypothetical protein ACLQGP_16060 [Isosphaeraceae bacterium]
MEPETLCFNGIDGSTGEYLLDPQPPEVISAVARGEEIDPVQLSFLKQWWDRVSKAHLGPASDVDPADLGSAGWGVIFAPEVTADSEVYRALKPLLDHRRAQASRGQPHYYREYMGPQQTPRAPSAYLAGESKQKFLARHGAGPGPADPEKVPYYLLIVGDPESIPYRFQYQLDVQHAVGRIHFETVEEYANYARGVVSAETTGLKLPRSATFFGVRNAADRATQLSADHLVKPLSEALAGQHPDWSFETVLAKDATKARLETYLNGREKPALLFTASHGLGFPNGHPMQFTHQGALLCQDWPGPGRERGPVNPDHYFSADDVAEDVSPHGLIAFHFACYGAGTPKLDDFAHQAFKKRSEIAPNAFLARLPQRLLAHPLGGAQAVIGHVERAWGFSFMWGKAGEQHAAFQSTLDQLLKGFPVGFATEYLNQRYAELASDLGDEKKAIEEDGKVVNDREMARLWTSTNDARSFIIVGDPAVRLAV